MSTPCNLFNSREDLKAVAVGVVRGRPVYLRKDVADKIVDGAMEPSGLRGLRHRQTLARHSAAGVASVSSGHHYRGQAAEGTNATDISNAVLKRVHEMQGVTIPNDVTVTTTRNSGETAKAKSDELLEHLLLATLSVTLLIALFLGWRESKCCLATIATSLALTMSVFYFLGYTINRRDAVCR